jgi:hypothetical protein
LFGHNPTQRSILNETKRKAKKKEKEKKTSHLFRKVLGRDDTNAKALHAGQIASTNHPRIKPPPAKLGEGKKRLGRCLLLKQRARHDDLFVHRIAVGISENN